MGRPGQAFSFSKIYHLWLFHIIHQLWPQFYSRPLSLIKVEFQSIHFSGVVNIFPLFNFSFSSLPTVLHWEVWKSSPITVCKVYHWIYSSEPFSYTIHIFFSSYIFLHSSFSLSYINIHKSWRIKPLPSFLFFIYCQHLAHIHNKAKYIDLFAF